jgi:radical SAM-linked protein
MGCHADGWTEHFQPQRWREAFAACGLSQEEYACRFYGKEEALPWQHIESGVSPKWLWREYELAAAGARTEDCRHEACSGCGVCKALDCHLQLARPLTAPRAAVAVTTPPPATQARERWRLRLAVLGPARWLSQLDLLAALEKALRRSGLPIAFSQGFNPHMLISWGPAHGVGLAGQSEYADLTFAVTPPADWPDKLNPLLPPGLRLLATASVAENAAALMAAIDRADYTLELAGDMVGPALDQAIEAFLANESYIVERSSPKGKRIADLRPAVLSLTRKGHTLFFSCRLNAGAVIKPTELIRALAPGAFPGAYCRTGMYIAGREPLPLG